MFTPEQKTKLESMRDACAEVAQVFDECSPWGGAARTMTKQVGLTLEQATGELTIEIAAAHRARFDEAISFIASMHEEEPRDDHRAPEEKDFLNSLLGGTGASPEGPVVVRVGSIAGQRALTEVLRICVSEAIRAVSHETRVNAHSRRRQFDEEVEAVDFWFGLLGRVEPAESGEGERGANR